MYAKCDEAPLSTIWRIFFPINIGTTDCNVAKYHYQIKSAYFLNKDQCWLTDRWGKS